MIHISASLPEQEVQPGWVQKKVEIELHQPAFLAILGRNGAGKSTLLKMLTGLLPYRGEILFSHPFAFLPQHLPVPFGLSALEVVAMGAIKNNQWNTPENRTNAKELLDFWGLAHLHANDFNTLSGGERQLIWLCQIQLQNHSIVILDEPTQSLDLYYTAKVFQWINAMVQQGKIVICVTHELEYIRRMEGRVLFMHSSGNSLTSISIDEIDRIKNAIENQL